MKRFLWIIALLCCLLPLLAAAAEEYTEVTLDEIQVMTAFPAEWVVVTPDTVSENFRYFEETTPEMAAEALRGQGVYAVAFSPEGDAMLRVMADGGDEDVRVYYDIERYTPAMRKAIRDHYLNREAWAETGYRYTEAEWTNKASRGRILNLTYAVRQDGEVVARGMQAYTIRAGMTYTLDLQVKGRQVTSGEKRIFATFLAQTAFPAALDMPLLPVGLTLTGVVPEETDVAEITLRGETMAGASVTAWLQSEEGEPVEVGTVAVGNRGTFRLDLMLPSMGEYRLHVVASLEGYAESEAGFWINYDDLCIPVNFTSFLGGDVLDAQVILAGKTVRGVSVVCEENGEKQKAVTSANGEFSFKLDRATVGERTVTLSLEKAGYMPRIIDIKFNRQWRMEDLVKYLAGQTQSLSYGNLCENPGKYIGRLVRYSGYVVSVSQAENWVYVQLALTKTKDGTLRDHIIAVADGLEVPLVPGESATLYIEVTGETYAFSDVTEEGDEVNIELPSVRLAAYERGL